MAPERLEISVAALSIAAISYVGSIRMGGLMDPVALTNVVRMMQNRA